MPESEHRSRAPEVPAPLADPLRVLLLAPAGSVHTRRWADDLAARGHTVTVCSWHGPGPDERARAWGLSCAPGAGSWRPWRALRAAGWLRGQVRRIRPDIIHVHSLGVHGALSLAVPTRAAPHVITPWGSELRAADRRPGRALVARLALRRADRVVPTSQEVAARVADRYRVPGARITVLSWGVPDHLLDDDNADDNVTRARFGIPAEATVVLSIRSAGDVYRTQEILDAFAEAADVRPGLHLVLLVGHRPAQPGAARAQQDHLATLRRRALELTGRVTVIDQLLTQSELFALMRASDVAVSVPRADQRSSSVLEAAAAGCRLLLADIAPYRELSQEGLHAHLLAEPLQSTLAGALKTAARLPGAERVANRELINRTERGSRQTTRLERLYEEIVRHGPDGSERGEPRRAWSSRGFRSRCR